jgi:predicted nucleic acid-binding protein
MILVDTSVWVDHLQRGNNSLAERRIALIYTHQLLSI